MLDPVARLAARPRLPRARAERQRRGGRAVRRGRRRAGRPRCSTSSAWTRRGSRSAAATWRRRSSPTPAPPASRTCGARLQDRPALLGALGVRDPARTNASTPREMTALLAALWDDRAAAPESCAAIRRLMGLQVWPHRLASGFPDDAFLVAGKTGTAPGIRNEIGVVEHARRPAGRGRAVHALGLAGRDAPPGRPGDRDGRADRRRRAPRGLTATARPARPPRSGRSRPACATSATRPTSSPSRPPPNRISGSTIVIVSVGASVALVIRTLKFRTPRTSITSSSDAGDRGRDRAPTTR